MMEVFRHCCVVLQHTALPPGACYTHCLALLTLLRSRQKKQKYVTNNTTLLHIGKHTQAVKNVAMSTQTSNCNMVHSKSLTAVSYATGWAKKVCP